MKIQERAHRVGTTARTQALTGKTNGIRTRRLPNGVIGNVGLFYVCYQLSRMGWNVMPTARNAKGVDLIAYSDDASRVLSLQVKALSKRAPVPLGTGLDQFFASYVVVCRHVLTDTPECFVLTPGEVRRLAHRGEKDGRVSYWLQPREYEAKSFHEAWGRIGFGYADSDMPDALTPGN